MDGQTALEGREKTLAYAAWAAVCIFWGTTYLAIRVGVHSMPPSLFSGLRFLAAGAILAAWLRWRGDAFPRGRDWLHLTVIGLALLGVGNWCVVYAEQSVPSGLTALLVALSPFWMTAIEALRPGGERIGPRGIAGLLVGFAGLVVLIGPRALGGEADGGLLLGFLAIQIGSASWSAGSVYSRHHPVEVKPLMGAAIQMLAAGVAQTLVGTATGEWSRFHPTPAGLGALLYLLVFGSLVAYSSYIYALQKLPISTVSLYAYLNPLIAVLLGWLLLGEHVGWREGVALTIILGGVALVKTAPARPRAEPASEAG